mmetsp:Transcript_12875/g.12773  ORF Transcript_12875/g.12773 Transcript_12875/m.12773 type:complete len:85 (+) Transcript_12875:465-719(+)
MNTLFTYLFIAANLMFTTNANHCSQIVDKHVKSYYYLFCFFIIIGYLQFIKCVMLCFMVPICAFLIHKLVQNYGVNENGELVVG